MGAQEKDTSSAFGKPALDASERIKARLAALYGRSEDAFRSGEKIPRTAESRVLGGGQEDKETDLSLLCERLFLSGLSSGRLAVAKRGEEDEQTKG